GGEQNPRPEFSPAGVRAVGENSHDRIGDCIPQARPEENRGGGGGTEPENFRIKSSLEKDHRHEDEVRGGIGGAVAGLFDKREFLLGGLFGHNMFWFGVESI